jgi:hypothetical protein
MAPAWTPPVAAMAAMATGPATPGQQRKPVMMLAMTLGAVIAANILTQVLGAIFDFGYTIGSLLSLAASILYLLILFKQVKELKAYLGGEDPPIWTFLIPFFKVPGAMGDAKRRAGSAKPETCPIWMYVIIPAFALQTDLNQIWDPSSKD